MDKTTYQEILESAFELFAEKGFDSTSMNDIAKKANVSKGGLYHHFDSKDDLLWKVFEETVVTQTVSHFFDFETLTKKNYKKRFCELGLHLIDSVKKNPTRKKFDLQVLTVLPRYPDLANSLQPFILQFVEKIEGFLNKGIQFGLISETINKPLTTEKFFLTLDMLELYSALKIEFDLESIWLDFVQSLLKEDNK